MNHQPFEEWLLNDKDLTPAEKRELDLHLRTCTHCTALSATGLALRSANVIAPVPGFATRFQHRLAAQKIADGRRKFWGSMVLIVSGVGLFGWFAAPYLFAVITAPVEWITIIIGSMLFIVSFLQVLAQLMTVFLYILPDLIPPYIWMIFLSALAGFGLLWTISIWRFSRAAQGVSV